MCLNLGKYAVHLFAYSPTAHSPALMISRLNHHAAPFGGNNPRTAPDRKLISILETSRSCTQSA